MIDKTLESPLDSKDNKPAAKSRQSCLTLCHPVDGSPLGSPIPVGLSIKPFPLLNPGSANYGPQGIFSWVSLPCCSPPGCPFSIKSLALSPDVSPQTIDFRVLYKSPVSGPGRGPLSCNRSTRVSQEAAGAEVNRARASVVASMRKNGQARGNSL